MRNIAKRSVAMLLLMVMVFSCFSNALTVTFASETSGTDPTVTVTTEPSEPADDLESGSIEGLSESGGSSEPTESTPTSEPTEAATDPTEAVTEPTEAETEPSEGATEPSMSATEPSEQETEQSTEATEATEGEAEPDEEETEPETEATEPEITYTKMEAETASNSHLYAENPVANENASNGYVVGGHTIESVFDLELYDDLATSELQYTPYVKYNVSASEAGTYELHIGVALKNLENAEDFYIPVVVNEKVYKATCEAFEGEDGIYEFIVNVNLVAGKNEVYCVTYDADTYLKLIAYDVSALSDAVVNFDYLGIPEGISALEKDAKPVENTEPIEETSTPTEDGNDPVNLPEGGEEETTAPTEAEETTEATEESTAPSEPEETTSPVEGEDDSEEGGSDDGLLIPSDEVIDPDGNGDIDPLANEGESGSGNTGGNGGGSTTPGEGTNQWSYVGVTIEIVTFEYGTTYDRNKSYNNIKGLITQGTSGSTVYNGTSISPNTFVLCNQTGRVYRLPGGSSSTGVLCGMYGQGANGGSVGISPTRHNCVTIEMGEGSATVGKDANYNATVTMTAPNDVEQWLQRIILGTNFGAWDVNAVAKDSSGTGLETWDLETNAPTGSDDYSTFARALRYLGCSDTLINNYVKAYTGQLDPENPTDAKVLIPSIIWSFVAVESNSIANTGSNPDPTQFYYYDSSSKANGTYFNQNSVMYGYNYNVYTIGSVAMYNNTEEVFNTWWTTPYADYDSCNTGFNQCKWDNSDSFACESMFGNHTGIYAGGSVGTHTHYIQAAHYAADTKGTGYVNRINSTAVDTTGNYYWFRGYWTPYGDMKTGHLSIQKVITPASSSNATNLAGWRFELYASESDAKNHTNPIKGAYTNSSGKATFYNLTYGKTYYISEAPASRQYNKETSGWTMSDEVFMGTVPENSTTNVGSATNSSAGALSAQKVISPSSMSNATNLAGWKFELYETEANAKNATNAIASAYTDSTGLVVFEDLPAGKTYYVREAPASRQDKKTTTGWTISATVLSGKVSAGVVTDVGDATNITPGQIVVKKHVTSSAGTTNKLNGWVYQISSNSSFTSIVTSLTTGSNGTANTGYTLSPGTYYVREAPLSAQTRSDKNNYVIDTTPVTVTVTAGGSVNAYQSGKSYTSDNIEKGKIRVSKGVVGADTVDDPYSGWIFDVCSDSACTLVITSITLESDGYGTSGWLAPGTYYVREAPKSRQTRSDKDLWVLDDTVTKIVINSSNNGKTQDAFSSARATAVNYYGKYLKVTKAPSSTDCWNQLKDNDMYSLAGAKFQLIVNGTVVETVTTGADGTVISNTLFTTGTVVTVKEITAPKGFLLNSTPSSVTIPATADEYAYITMTNKPSFDPVTPKFTKIDPETGNPQGNTSFEGAVFKMEYYDNTSWSGTPVKTWYFKTNSSGYFLYSDSYKASGYTSDALYKGVYGEFNIPLGSVKLTEVVVPYGYSAIPVLYATITQPSNGAEAVFAWTTASQAVVDGSDGNYTGEEPDDESTFGGFTIYKRDINGNASVQGDVPSLKAKFQVINRSDNSVKIGSFAEAEPGKVCYEFWTDDSGYFASGKIFPVGKYEIVEVTQPTGMTLNGNWSGVFEVTKTAKDFSFTCKNDPIRGAVTIQKFDNDDNTANEQGEATLAGAVFKIVNNSDHKVYTDRDGNGTYAWYNPGEVCLYITTNADGIAASADKALPYGSYTAYEHAAPTGYLLNSAWSKSFTIRTDGERDNITTITDTTSNATGALPEDVIRGGIKIVKYDALLGTATTKDANLDGITYSIYSENDNYVYVDGVKYNKGDVVATMALSWNASEGKWIAQLDGDTLPYGTYTVRENPKEAGSDYANDYYFLANENDVVEEYTFSIRTNGQIVTTSTANKAMEFHNLPIGRIEILKVDVRDKKLEGVKFSLEWSTDGATWTPVVTIPYGDLVQGGSTTAGIVTGCLVTDKNGILAYEGLDPRLQYRLVEVETLNNYQLLKDPVYVGVLGRDASSEVNYQVKVVNQDILELPKTGSMAMVTMSVASAICATISFVALAYFRKKEEEV